MTYWQDPAARLYLLPLETVHRIQAETGRL